MAPNTNPLPAPEPTDAEKFTARVAYIASRITGIRYWMGNADTTGNPQERATASYNPNEATPMPTVFPTLQDLVMDTIGYKNMEVDGLPTPMGRRLLMSGHMEDIDNGVKCHLNIISCSKKNPGQLTLAVAREKVLRGLSSTVDNYGARMAANAGVAQVTSSKEVAMAW